MISRLLHRRLRKRSVPFRRHLRFTGVLAALLLLGAGSATAQPLLIDGFETGDFCGWHSQVGAPGTYLEAFTGPDGSARPTPWTAIGSVALADLQSGQARFRPVPSGYSLARLFAPVETRDAEVTFTLVFEDVASQGVGFYVRQNGGYLQQTPSHGQGYAVFVEGFRETPGIGVWREVDGHEQDLQILFDPALNFQDGVPYRVRFRVTQLDASTSLLQAKVWPLAGTEPADWQVEAMDATPSLQNVSGGIALDSWSSRQSPDPITAHTLVDDVEVAVVCPPPE
jgi:hypothetical protein